MKATLRNDHDTERLVRYINAQEKPLQVDVRPYKEDKTLPQLRLVHKWLSYIGKHYAESTGKYYTQEMWKQYFKELFGEKEEKEVMGKTIIV